MRIFASKDFEKYLTKLDARTQNRYFNFIDKLSKAPDANGLNLEPLKQAASSNIWSGRIDDRYRIIMCKKGDAFIKLYIGNHEDAYRWAETKKVEFNEKTTTIQMYDIVTTPMPAPAPAPTPSPLAPFTDDQLLAIGVPADLLERVRTYADYDAMMADPALPEDAADQVGFLLLGEDYDQILADVTAGKAAEGEDPLLSDNNRRFFVETTDEDLQRVLDGNLDDWQVYLHPSQRRLAERPTSGATKVSGSAGTGKTVVALHRLKNLAAKTGAHVLYTTYTTALSTNLGELAKKMDIPANKYRLYNLDTVLRKEAQQLGIINDETRILDYNDPEGARARDLWQEVLDEADPADAIFSASFLQDEYTDVILYNGNKSFADYSRQRRPGRGGVLSRSRRAAIWRLVEAYKKKKEERGLVERSELFNLVTDRLLLKNHNDLPYTNVIVDEFQDFSNPELRFLRALTPEGPDDLFLVGDPYQRIYPARRMKFSAAGINVRGRSHKLKVNYRTTEEIKRMAVQVVSGVKYDDLDGGEENNRGYHSITHGAAPQYEILPDKAAETERVLAFVRELHEADIPYADICVSAPTRRAYNEMRSALYGAKIPFCEIEKGRLSGDKDGVRFCTFHSLKGLEFQALALVDVTQNSIPSAPDYLPPYLQDRDEDVIHEALMRARSLLYVAITRARTAVLVTGVGQPTGLLTVNG